MPCPISALERILLCSCIRTYVRYCLYTTRIVDSHLFTAIEKEGKTVPITHLAPNHVRIEGTPAEQRDYMRSIDPSLTEQDLLDMTEGE